MLSFSRHNLEEFQRLFRESGSRQEMSLQQFSDLLDLAAKVPKERAKSLFSVLSHPKPFAGVMGVECDGLDDDAGESSTLDFRRFLLAAVTALDEGAISKDSSEFIFNIYDADADGALADSQFCALVQHLHSFSRTPSSQHSTMSTDEIALRVWLESKEDQSSTMKLQEFQIAMSMEPALSPPPTRQLFAAVHPALLHRRHDLPSVTINGVLVADERISEGREGESVISEWTYMHKAEIKLSELEVGLRKELRKRVSEQGFSVVVQVLEGDSVKESAELFSANNFRCRWPDLEENPVLFTGGFILSLTMVEEGHHLMMFPPTLPIVPQLDPPQLISDPQVGRKGNSEANCLEASMDKDDDDSSDGGSLYSWRHKPEGGEAGASSRSKRPADMMVDTDLSTPNANKQRRFGGAWSGGKGKGPMHLAVPTPRRTPLMSPMGIRSTAWKLASYTVKLNRHHGTVENFEMLWQRDAHGRDKNCISDDMHASAPHTPRSFLPETPTGAGRASPFSLDSPRSRCGADSPSEGPSSTSGRVQSYPFVRAKSELPFDVHSAPNQLVEALRFFEMPVSEKNKPAFSWGQQPMQQMEMLSKFIVNVARDVRKLCLAEPRCVHVRAPCYILGDLHGNYQDLIAFEKALWRIGPALSPANFLLLGDYVDRGAHSVEVITYLLAQKLMCPGKFVLLRGNHETRLQNSFSGYNPCFKDSCVALFGTEAGETVWESVNAVFDTLPLAAVIDNSIFCVHGGIPPPSLVPQSDFTHSNSGLVTEINKIPKDISQPDPQQGGCPLAWDLMWNDPAPSASMPDGSVGKDGFGFNISRGTGHMFTAEALDVFLKSHGFSHLVRAHEVRKTGFQVQQHARMVTLFSSSGYCGAGNEACCILACEGKMRFIRLEHHTQPKLGSLASRAAAAGAVAAALHTGRQVEERARAERQAAEALAARQAEATGGSSHLGGLDSSDEPAHRSDLRSGRLYSCKEEDDEAGKANNINLSHISERDHEEEENAGWTKDGNSHSGGAGADTNGFSEGDANSDFVEDGRRSEDGVRGGDKNSSSGSDAEDNE